MIAITLNYHFRVTDPSTCSLSTNFSPTFSRRRLWWSLLFCRVVSLLHPGNVNRSHRVVVHDGLGVILSDDTARCLLDIRGGLKRGKRRLHNKSLTLNEDQILGGGGWRWYVNWKENSKKTAKWVDVGYIYRHRPIHKSASTILIRAKMEQESTP